MNYEQSELSTLPDDLWSYSDDVFYDFVKKFVGQIEGEILEIQHIKNVRILLQIPDIFSFFHINCKETYDLKKKACFIDDAMNFIVREGIKCNIEQFIDLLKRYYESRLTNTNTILSHTTTSIEKNKSNQCICDLINIDGENEQYQSKPFINIFLSNLLKNMKRSKNNFQFHPIVTKFASVFRILAGHNAYEFIRINLLGSLPSDTTLKNYDENINFKLNECEFRFDLLKDYLDSIKSQYVFSSEDASGVVSSVSYDAINDSFIGFTPSLNNGLPVINQFKTNSYSELEQWFHDIDKSTLVNVHLIEPLLTDVTSLVRSRPYIISAYGISKGRLPSHALNCHLFSSQPCESTFRSARSLSGSLSSITTFSVSQFINKIGKISILNQIKSTQESSNNEYSLKFPRHHKNRRDESHASTNIQNVPTITIQHIEKIIIKAYNKAVIIMNNLLITEILKESNLDDIHKLSSFVFHKLDKRSTVDYSIINNFDAYDSLDDDDNDNIVNEPSNIDLLEYIEESPDEHEHEAYNLTTSKQTFFGMKIYEKINSTKINNYFKIIINHKHYYMHKQTPARLLTVNKNHLSSDRRFRVKHTSKQH
ncbi:unnamed protein product [Rotaria sordida]|uniref:Uncharacterized protein n=1 Tax=Rotaria sordida TaxID=392033 RepID=A0A818WDL6_9BILA|nr:unnamed protein product [Rotaria sordida]